MALRPKQDNNKMAPVLKCVRTRCLLRLLPTHNSCGPGSGDGCLSSVLLDTDASAAIQRAAPPRREADRLKNMYGSGPKTGGAWPPAWMGRCSGVHSAAHPASIAWLLL
jgi:hypothetical protein